MGSSKLIFLAFCRTRRSSTRSVDAWELRGLVIHCFIIVSNSRRKDAFLVWVCLFGSGSRSFLRRRDQGQSANGDPKSNLGIDFGMKIEMARSSSFCPIFLEKTRYEDGTLRRLFREPGRPANVRNQLPAGISELSGSVLRRPPVLERAHEPALDPVRRLRRHRRRAECPVRLFQE